MKLHYLLFCVFALITHSTSANTSTSDLFAACQNQAHVAELDDSLCTIVKVPLTHSGNANETTIDLFVRKFPALKTQQGSIWLIAGGPGESGASFYRNIDLFRNTFPNFDLMVPDHRGTGFSSTICPQEAPDTVGGTSLVGEEWGACSGHMYSQTDYVKAFSISNAAKDLEALIETLSPRGEKFVYGVSYGTQLALRLLQITQIQLDGVILDSLVPLQDDATYELSKRSFVVNDVGSTVLKRCMEDEQCKVLQLDQKIVQDLLLKYPLLSDVDETLPQAKLSNVLGSLLDVPAFRNRIPQILFELKSGQFALLSKTLNELTRYYGDFNLGYKNFGSSIPLVQVISSSENNLRPEMSKEQVVEEEKGLVFTSPLPGLLAGNNMPTYAKDDNFAKLPGSMSRVLVLHGTLDSKTHLKGAQRHVDALSSQGDVKLVKMIDTPHFVALYAPECFTKLAKEFIAADVDLASQCMDKNAQLTFTNQQ